MIRREWKIPDFPDTELLQLCVDAWRLVGTVISQIIVYLGGGSLDMSLPCRHEPEGVRTMEFSQREFFESVDGLKASG